ncbi:transcription initiation factor TFIID subunit 10 [Nematocida homosporus]|uniref:transcription initiation factor TFIID subunit 10 n=1 Tax=Nematocida homosporus TaxID=1912981 RepID=UPI0022200A8C|nr:transcription initiation factor TFIID subunit 10 [Nematocida homosporus]KAI5185293.1 transcription initiation factor TFIID subunit 10 [Nematocida homosporus]
MEDSTFNRINEGLESFVPLIPEVVLDFCFTKAGLASEDPKLKKLVSLVAQKLITDVATCAYQYHKIAQRASLKEKKTPKEKKLTLTLADVENTLKENGINISRPSYFF